MTMLNKLLVLAVVAAVALSAPRVLAQSGYDLFQRALTTERADGKLREAIQLYQRVVDGAKTDRALAVQALVRIADCYQKLGDTQARRVWELVARDYTDQKAEAAEAKARLMALAAPATAPGSQTARLVWKGQEAFGSVRGTISPDGRYLTFLDLATGGLALRDFKENSSRVLAQEPGNAMFYAIFSPDGRRIAYSWATRTPGKLMYDLRVISVSGPTAQPTVVYRNEEMNQLRPFGWTPDSKHVLALRSLRDGTNQITMIRPEDGHAQVLKSVNWNYTAMSLSPDGRFIAYDGLVGTGTSSKEIFVLATDGSRETKVVEGPDTNRSPLWSPDGSRLVFLSNRTGTLSLWSMPMRDGRANGPAELVKANIGDIRTQGFTRVGALHYLASGVTSVNVYIADLDDEMKVIGAPRIVSHRFVNSNSAPTWSPDGQRLAYLSSRGQAGRILVIRTMASGEEKDISLPASVQTGNLVPAPRWFPDGRSVLVLGFLPAGAGRYYRVDVATGRTELIHEANGLTGNGGLGSAAIASDGRALFYTVSATTPFSGTTNVARLDLETREVTVIRSGSGNSLAQAPDGTNLATRTFDGTPGGCALAVMPVGGGPIRDIVKTTGSCNPNRTSWTSNNHLLYVMGGNTTPNVIWHVPVDGGMPQQIGISMPGQLDNPELSPDRRHLTFAVFETGASEVWALENFLPKPIPQAPANGKR
jgi:Tol biopolymer transport system component